MFLFLSPAELPNSFLSLEQEQRKDEKVTERYKMKIKKFFSII